MSAPGPFAAVLLAGGRSRRMGRDKALLPLANGQLLWQRQLDVLRQLGPAELFISGPEQAGYPASVPRLEDAQPDLGPLGGIAVVLRAMRSLRLVVLAVDLPMMTANYLRGLVVEDCAPDLPGIIPQMGDGFFEPLAAVYPRSALTAAETQLRGTDRSLQTFARGLVGRGLAVTRPVAEAETGLFTNWNQPGDIHPGR